LKFTGNEAIKAVLMVPKLHIAGNQLFRTMYKKNEHIDEWRSDVTRADRCNIALSLI